MLKKILTFCNHNHWYVIASFVMMFFCIWLFGCSSKTTSLIDNEKQVDRMELQSELDYLIGIARARAAEIDRKDAFKQELVNAASVIGQGGALNPSGLISILTSLGAVSFGLDRNYKMKTAKKEVEILKDSNDSKTDTTGTA